MATSTGPDEFICPITGQSVQQSILAGMKNITKMVVEAAYTVGSCGHRHRLDSPSGNSGWIVDGGTPERSESPRMFNAPPGVWAMPDGSWWA